MRRPRGATVALARWGEAIRRVPVGVLILAAALAFLGGGFILGGLYLIFGATALGWPGWAMVLLAAPLSLYMALHLVLRSRWAWLTMMIVLVLLLISSLLRAFFSPGFPGAALLEIAVELTYLYYLMRPHVRSAFHRV